MCLLTNNIKYTDRKERESDLFTATRKYGDLGRHEQFCFCSDLMRLLFSESFKRCRLRAGSVINYGPRSGFYYYNMKPPTILWLVAGASIKYGEVKLFL
jgi:hypothetical protein